jgi:hypothetical protein
VIEPFSEWLGPSTTDAALQRDKAEEAAETAVAGSKGQATAGKTDKTKTKTKTPAEPAFRS